MPPILALAIWQRATGPLAAFLSHIVYAVYTTSSEMQMGQARAARDVPYAAGRGLLEADAHARPVAEALHELVDQMLRVGATRRLRAVGILAGDGGDDLAMRLQE